MNDYLYIFSFFYFLHTVIKDYFNKYDECFSF
jgi:hypothetical protein